MWKLFRAGMHSSIVAACLAASITTSAATTSAAATNEEWRDAMRKAITHLYDYKEQSIHALNSDRGMGEDRFVTVVKALCQKHQDLFLQVYMATMWERGSSKEEIIDKSARLIVEQDDQLRSIHRQFEKR
jgi:UDP-N-acetylmuramyl tripeptide synthase